MQSKIKYLLHIYTKYNNIRYMIHKRKCGGEEKEKESREV